MSMYPIRTYPPLFGTDGLAGYMSGRWKCIIPIYHGWSTSNTGSGGGYTTGMKIVVNTGTSPSSRGMYFVTVYGLNSGDIGLASIDWTKRLELHFILAREISDPEVRARVQLKESNTEGALAQRGIGVSINNFDLIGESYGTSRGTVSLGSLTTIRSRYFRIVKDFNIVEFWVDNVKRGELTGEYVPKVKGTDVGYLVISIVNGTTGGANAHLHVGDIKIFQEW